VRILGVLVFLTAATVRNRVKAQLRRLRRPRYLVATGFGLLYLWFFFGRRLEVGAPEALGPGGRSTLVLGGAALWGSWLLSLWIFGRKRPALAFTEAEIQFLFPAPVTRRALLLYKMGRSFLLVGLSALITTVLFGARLSGSFWFFLVGAWAALGLHSLHEMGVQLGRGRLLSRGARGGAALAAGVCAVVLAVGLVAHLALPRPLPPAEAAALVAWGREVLAGPVGWVLVLTRAPLELALSPDLPHFLRWLPLSVGLGALHVAWILRSDTGFEEASVEEAARRARMLELRRAGAVASRPDVPRSSTALSVRGRPEWALVWKNLLATRRLMGGRLWGVALPLGLALAVSGMWLGASGARGGLPTGLAMSLAGAAGLVSLLGPGMLRSDFRGDHVHMELLRTLPLSGAQVVVGQLAAPWLLLLAAQWGFLLCAAVAASVGAVRGDAVGALAVTLAAGAGVGFVLPGVTLMQLLVQNAVVLLLPGWADVGAERARGLEAFGQRLLLFAGSLLVLLLAFIPAALAGGLVGALGVQVMGAAALPLGGLVAAAVLMGEAAAAVLLLGRVFDDYDVSSA
jgi:ABC-2 type transport system permease protein